MIQGNAAAGASDEQQGSSVRPVKTFKQGGVEVSIWKNTGRESRADIYNATISKSYRDEASGEWRDSTSFSPTDLAVVAQLSSQAFQAIGELKLQSRGR